MWIWWELNEIMFVRSLKHDTICTQIFVGAIAVRALAALHGYRAYQCNRRDTVFLWIRRKNILPASISASSVLYQETGKSSKSYLGFLWYLTEVSSCHTQDHQKLCGTQGSIFWKNWSIPFIQSSWTFSLYFSISNFNQPQNM